MRKIIGKPLISAVLAALLILSVLAGCTGSPASSDDTSATNSTNTAKEETNMSQNTTVTTITTSADDPAALANADDPGDQDAGRFLYKTTRGTDLYLYLKQPKTRVYDRAPLLVHIVGGGWTHYEVKNYFSYFGTYESELSKEGFAGLTVGHVGSDNGGSMEEIVADVLDTFGYIAKYNDVFKIDLNRIVFVGQSAGAHLGLLLSLADHSLLMKDCAYTGFDYHVIGAVGMATPTMLYQDVETGKQLFPDWGGGPVLGNLFHNANCFVDDTDFRRYSPIEYVSASMPPVLLLVGDKDTVVAPKQSYLFNDKAEGVGAACTMVVIQNGDHSLQPVDAAVTTPSAAKFYRQMIQFVQNLVK